MDIFFGIQIGSGNTLGMSLALVLAVILGGAIGIERETHGHPAGLRTHILVCVGSALMTLVSVHLAPTGDPGRIAAQIVTGIGFLGAGAIVRGGRTVHGLTTAASIWTTAGIGIAVGAAPHFGELAVIATVIVVLTLWLLNRLESHIAEITQQIIPLTLEISTGRPGVLNAFGVLKSHGIRVVSHERHSPRVLGLITIHAKVRVPDMLDADALNHDLAEVGAILIVRSHPTTAEAESS
jgi:putative Mg2+ transporter-C (MgtC) family protein